MPSPLYLALTKTSSSTVITQESSKVGGSIDTATKLSTESFGEYTTSYTIYPTVSTLSQRTSLANSTQQTTHPEAYSDPSTFFYLPSIFPSSLTPSSSTPPSHSPPPSYGYCETGNTPFPRLSSSIAPYSDNRPQNGTEHQEQKKRSSSLTLSKKTRSDYKNRTRFDAPLYESPALTPTPQNYKPSLKPHPSHLRPHCLARERLRLWTPAGNSTRQLAATTEDPNAHDVSDEQLNRMLEVMGSAWAQSTKETYGAGLLVFHVYCDFNHIDEDKRCPVSSNLLLQFLSSCAGAYSGSSLANFAAGIKAWHLLHGRPWLVQPDELKATLGGATVLAPSASKRPKRQPFTPEFISTIRNHLDLDKPLDAAVFACMMTTFYCIARLGEFTVRTVKGFDPKKHVS
ncbi:hypothetical protein P692DRAFT_20879941 [Suillus brevipes Sb2]|nr:hypothetical protein P692DRAFT_20879941 [Suillus brevipes Sb2]